MHGFSAPVDVQLDCDEKTMVQPDVLVVCDCEKIVPTHVYGAPDLIMEILSPATRKIDMNIKHSKYAAAGVREYWLIDPDKKKVVVYDLENEELPVVYGFENRVPVGIFQGECEIDFSEIYESVKFCIRSDLLLITVIFLKYTSAGSYPVTGIIPVQIH